MWIIFSLAGSTPRKMLAYSSSSESEISPVNSGSYRFSQTWLFEIILSVSNDNFLIFAIFSQVLTQNIPFLQEKLLRRQISTAKKCPRLQRFSQSMSQFLVFFVIFTSKTREFFVQKFCAFITFLVDYMKIGGRERENLLFLKGSFLCFIVLLDWLTLLPALLPH